MLNDKTSAIRLHLWLPSIAAYDFLNLFRVIDFRDLHTACESRGGGRSRYQVKKKKDEVTLDTKLELTQRMTKTSDFYRSQSLEVTSHHVRAQRG